MVLAIELRVACERQHRERRAALLHPGDLIVVRRGGVAARQRAGLVQVREHRERLLHRGRIGHELESGADEIAAEGARERDRECRQVARDNHADHRRAGLRAERELLRLVDQLLERRRAAP